jgi:hypothetical protein
MDWQTASVLSWSLASMAELVVIIVLIYLCKRDKLQGIVATLISLITFTAYAVIVPFSLILLPIYY